MLFSSKPSYTYLKIHVKGHFKSYFQETELLQSTEKDFCTDILSNLAQTTLNLSPPQLGLRSPQLRHCDQNRRDAYAVNDSSHQGQFLANYFPHDCIMNAHFPIL